MSDEALRAEFAQFLDDVVRGGESASDWDRFLDPHYSDEGLEQIRHDLLMLAITRNPRGYPVWLDSDLEQLRRWAEQLRERRDSDS